MEKRKEEIVTTLNYKKYNRLNNWKDVRINDREDVGIDDGIIVGIIKGTWLIKVISCRINRKLTDNGKKE